MATEEGAPPRTAPQRSVLHGLAPVGVGTPFVESAESYLRRLATSHAVERAKLHHFINDAGEPIYGDLRGQTARVDAPTQNAMAFMHRTAQLTRQPDVAKLGLGWLAAHVTAQHSLRRHRAWCGGCFLEMQSRGLEPHTHMLWCFAQLNVCPRHGAPLADSCPACGKASAVTRERPGPIGACWSCGQALSCDASSELGAPPRPASLRDLAIAEQLGRLLMVAREPARLLQRPSFAQIVLSLRRRGVMVSARELSIRMGVSKGTLSDLMKDRSDPGLDLLLRLATALAVPLSSFFVADAALSMAGIDDPVGHQPIIWPPRTKPRKDWAQVQLALDLESKSDMPVSLPQFAGRVGVDPKHLGVRLPEAAASVRRRHRAAVSAARQGKIQDVVRQLIAVSRIGFPSQRVAARSIGVQRTRRCFREAWSR